MSASSTIARRLAMLIVGGEWSSERVSLYSETGAGLMSGLDLAGVPCFASVEHALGG